MPDPMTPPRACVEAVTNRHPPLCERCPTECGPRCKSCDAICARIASAVLAAFVAGEPSGRWRVLAPVAPMVSWYVVDGRGSAWLAKDREQAVGIANVLNYLEAQRG